MILQLKTGRLRADYFEQKFGVRILDRFGDGFRQLAEGGDLTVTGAGVEMTRKGLLQVDRLLPTFFEPEFQGSRYT